ncbi:Serine/threonine-protein kinase PknB [Aquisphaera giovannonii]|uniref:Serine/threonine-protein kinase PknB n=1 Tax=Aquisphaera giovannonii TaxID=406548 RepID=A0A5B9VUY6_9BACT|nr:serine/threonine-protein kinase [Aquisphaera giovannonii]QEH32296.1 Serine/threonine-protein kinase PknB [Aquisphaera giovannonii]
MIAAETCPDCDAPLPADAPAGLCPRCLLRLGAALPEDPPGRPGLRDATGAGEPRDGSRGALMDGGPRIHLRETVEDAPLIRPAWPGMPDAPGRPSRYQLVGEIARGGMGAIFQGRDLELGRDLAVKVIREEHRDDPEMVRRFVEEAQIGGQLQHPGIVPVHELGRLPDGRVFIAMKLVRGRTLAALLAARRGPDDDRVRFLSIFERVCQAMAYAHARGVVHRDLKPSNIMVGAFGEAQIMDWGLAKVLDQGGVADEGREARPRDDPAVWTLRSRSAAMESRPGSVLGTPAYMAPEQARGELDTLDERADVFALGSILCEVLTGVPAFAGESGAEAYRKAERADLSEASARLDACDADAELVGLARACLAAAPKHRPRDAGVVVARLTAYLRGVEGRLREAELAQARAETRAADERRRRRLTLALAASVLAAVGIGSAGWGRIERERRSREERTRGAVDAALADASARRQRALAAGGDPVPWIEAVEAARRAESALASGDAGDASGARVRAFLADVTRERDAAEAAEKDRRIVERVAAILNDFGVHADDRRADAEYDAAFRAYGLDLDATDPAAAGRALATSPAAAELASALDQWAFLRRGRTLRDAAGAERLVAMARAADPDPWRDRLRDTLGRREGGPARRVEALERLAATADVEHLPVTSVTRLAASLAFLGRRGTAIALLRRAQASHRDDFWVNADLARELMATGRAEDAARFFSVAAGVRPRSGLALAGLGKALLQAGQPAEAADAFREVTRLRPDDGPARVALGAALLALGEPQEADLEFAEARRLRPDDWSVRDQIALAHSERGEWADAVDEQRASARRFPNLPVAHKALAHALQASGRLDEAVAEFREAARLDPHFSAAHLYLGRALIEAGEPRAALDSLARVEAGPPPDPVLTAPSLIARAERMIALEARLPEVLAGRDRPSDPGDLAALAQLAFARRRHAASARLWADAFDASPALAADLAASNRLQAARAAAMAGAEGGAGGAPSGGRSPAQWRQQALAWLEADLAASSSAIDSSGVPQRAAVARRLGRWLVDPAFAAIRDEPIPGAMSESERQSLRGFWGRVVALRARATSADAEGGAAPGNPWARL